MKKILLLGMVDSVHVSRWLKTAINESEVDIYLIPTSPHRRLHPELSSLIEQSHASNSRVTVHPLLRYISILVWMLDLPVFFRGNIRALFIRQAVSRLRPDMVHIMETQNGGYPYLAFVESKRAKVESTPYRLVLTLFGSDLYWFSRFHFHKARLSRLLPKVDVLAAECERDVEIAIRLGFRGRVARLSPVSGGLNPRQMALPDTAAEFESRDVIAIKGYGGTWGLGHVAIQSLSQTPEKLAGKQIVIFSAGSAAKRAAKKYLRPLGMRYTIYPKFALSHIEMLDLYRRSLIYIGLSRSDGLPASMLEAMSQGAFPVQTSSACIDGWFRTGETGLVVNVEDVTTVGESVSYLLSNLTVLRKAQSRNLATIRARYSSMGDSQELSYSELLLL